MKGIEAPTSVWGRAGVEQRVCAKRGRETKKKKKKKKKGERENAGFPCPRAHSPIEPFHAVLITHFHTKS
jgi:hypothetical protein